MSGFMRWMTYALLFLPLILARAASRPGPQAPILIGATLFVLLIYASVWFWWRPSRFDVSSAGLTIVFPLRRRFIPRDSIIGARTVNKSEFREQYGWGMRVGAGGLWGGFGYLLTSKRGRVDFYITSMDRWALVERRGAPDLLVSADPPDQFAAAVSNR